MIEFRDDIIDGDGVRCYGIFYRQGVHSLLLEEWIADRWQLSEAIEMHKAVEGIQTDIQEAFNNGDLIGCVELSMKATRPIYDRALTEKKYDRPVNKRGFWENHD